MKNKVITITLAVGLSLTAQAQQFNGTGYNLNNRDFLIIQGTVNSNTDANQAHRERMANYERISAEMSASIDAMRAEGEMRRQTYELRKQTELLRKIADQ